MVITKFSVFSATRVATCSVAVPQVTSTVARGGTKCFNRRWRGELVTLDLDKVLNKLITLDLNHHHPIILIIIMVLIPAPPDWPLRSGWPWGPRLLFSSSPSSAAFAAPGRSSTTNCFKLSILKIGFDQPTWAQLRNATTFVEIHALFVCLSLSHFLCVYHYHTITGALSTDASRRWAKWLGASWGRSTGRTKILKLILLKIRYVRYIR